MKNEYLDAKEKNKKLFKDKVELKVKFKSELANMSYMLFDCSSLKSIGISSLNTSKVNNMSFLFSDCSSLE